MEKVGFKDKLMLELRLEGQGGDVSWRNGKKCILGQKA